MADTKTYLYSVNPRKTITGLANIPSFRSPRSLFLTLEDVKICVEKATVYRRFANEGRLEKVTIGNYERLHNDVFMTEEEYEKFKANELGKNSSTVKEEPQTASTPLKDDKGQTDETPAKEESVPVEEKKESDVATSEDPVDAESEELYESDEDEVIEKEDTAE